MNLLGLTGAAGSGKDTAAAMLAKRGWQPIALADPMKRAVKEWFQFTDEQLWGPSEKRNEGDPRYPIGDLRLVGAIEIGPGPAFPVRKKTAVYLTPRHALQRLGTEFGRASYEDVWVDLAIRTTEFLLSGIEKTSYPPMYPAYEPTRGHFWRRANTTFHRQGVTIIAEGYGNMDEKDWYRAPTGVVITDCRFDNEARAVRAAGGRIVRLTGRGGLSGAAGLHASEAGISPGLVDIVIDNSGTLEALERQIEAIVTYPPRERRAEGAERTASSAQREAGEDDERDEGRGR